MIAAQDETTVSVEPAIVEPFVLQRGEWFEVSHSGDLVFSGSDPIQVAQILASQAEVSWDGRPCTQLSDCEAGQQCVIFPNKEIGSCRSTCAVGQSDCPYASDGCHERSWHYPAVLEPGDGLCYRELCGPSTPCSEGGACVDGVNGVTSGQVTPGDPWVW